MTTSGTWNFNPAIGEVVLYAFGLCGVRAPSLLQEHMFDARMAANMVLLDWSNKQVNLWEVDLVTVPLVEGQATYDVDPNTITMLDAYMTIDNGVSPPIDRIILPVSRSEYASYPNKEQQGFTTVFWFNRLMAPTVTLWPVPDGTSAQFLKYYRVTQIQDAVLGGGVTNDMPPRWIPAFTDALAAQLSRSWAPARFADLTAQAILTYRAAANQDTETANFYVSPMLAGYYRP